MTTPTPDTATKAKTCSDCQAPLDRSLLGKLVWLVTDSNNHACENPHKQCEARLCTVCHVKRPLMIIADGDATSSTTSTQEDKDGLAKVSLKCFCQSCFEEVSTVNYASSYSTIETPNASVVFVFAHGASGTREMFHYHALELKEKFGHSSILLDLPGHAKLVDQPLTLASATETVQSVLKECQALIAGKKVIYVGASLGGYIGFHILKQLPDTFAGAVILDCGQNVGPGASLKARAGLVVLEYLGRKMSNATLMKLMVGELQKSKNDNSNWYHIVPSTCGAGMFFDQAGAHVECLRQVAPAELLPSISIPIFFMNGSEDHRDSEDKWLSLCQNQEVSELKVYQGGDHFFTHDARFVPDILTQMDAFSKKL